MDALHKLINCVVTFIAVVCVGGYLTAAYSQDGDIRDRLLMLKRLALGLESRDVTRNNLATSEYEDDTADYKAKAEWNSPFSDYLSDVVLSNKREIGREDQHQLNRVEKSSNELDIFRSNYAIFHSALTNFVNALPSKFMDNAPAELSKVTIIPAAFTPDDPDLVNGNVDKIFENWFNMRNVTNIVLENIESFLRPESIQWFTSQKSTLSFELTMVDISAASLTFFENTYDPDNFRILSAGIGGVNYGTADAIKRLEDIRRQMGILGLIKLLQ